MSSRKIVDMYEHKFESRYNRILELIDALKIQIDFILEHENNNEWLRGKQEELNNLGNILKEYVTFGGKYDIENLSDELLSYMAKKHPDGKFPKEDVIEFYNQSPIYSNYKKYINMVLAIEDEIHERITLNLWKEYCTPINGDHLPVNYDFQQGEEFRYIVHSGYNIIKLPELPGYTKTRHIDGDFVSASLITNEQMHMYNGNVGLILEPNEAIIASSIGDSGTRIDTEQGLNSVFDFGNGTFVNTRLDRAEYIPTKIQSPRNLHVGFMNELKRMNVDGLDEGWPVNEIILDDRRVKVIGVFFRVSENQLSLHDFVRAHNMSVMYKVPLRIINVDKYRNKEESEIHNYDELKNTLNKEIKDNYDLIRLYLSNVVYAAEFSDEVKKIFQEAMERYQELNNHKIEDEPDR